MPRVFYPLLKILAHATHRDLAAQVQYLKVENEILRSKLPKRVTVRGAVLGHGSAHCSAVAEGQSSVRLMTEHPPSTVSTWPVM